jgi:hypothetical protein
MCFRMTDAEIVFEVNEYIPPANISKISLNDKFLTMLWKIFSSECAVPQKTNPSIT